jgi:Na+-driven multidrug efflux pump
LFFDTSIITYGAILFCIFPYNYFTLTSATENAKEAFTVSVARGCFIIVPLALLLSVLLKITGIWLSFALTECIVTIIAIIVISVKKAVSNKEKITIGRNL